jgi:hypothetical protein
LRGSIGKKSDRHRELELLEGLIYQFVYNLERHRLFRVRLHRWLIFLCLILPLAMWFRLWGASYFTSAFSTLIAAGVLVAMWWARRQRYVRFVDCVQSGPATYSLAAEESTRRAASQHSTDLPLAASSKVRVQATGFFEVSGRRRYFVEARADYTTFETREHCVMARIPLSRFLLLSKSNEDETGWWYIFFQPSMIRSVEAGLLYFGRRPRPALRLEVAHDDNHKGEVLHLSFETEATRSRVMADLRHDIVPD